MLFHESNVFVCHLFPARLVAIQLRQQCNGGDGEGGLRLGPLPNFSTEEASQPSQMFQTIQ